MILVTGASGSVGSALVEELRARDAGPIRVIERKPRGVAWPTGVGAVIADFADPPSLDRALAGVEAAYLVCSPVPELVTLETNFLLGCERARTPHVVIQSALGAGEFLRSFPAWHRQVEEKAGALGIPCTILRPNGFMQNISNFFAASIRADDCFFDALGTAQVSWIDVRDIAAAAAAALSSRATINEVFELNGPEPIANHELASRISSVAGRTIRYVELTPDQMRQGMISAGMPESSVIPIIELYEYYRAGKAVGSDQMLRKLLNRTPRSVDAYLTEIAPLFAKSTGGTAVEVSHGA